MTFDDSYAVLDNIRVYAIFKKMYKVHNNDVSHLIYFLSLNVSSCNLLHCIIVEEVVS